MRTPAPVPSSAALGAAGGSDDGDPPDAATPAGQPAPDAGGAGRPRDLQAIVRDTVTDVAGTVVTGVASVVKPAAAAAVANTFSFPLALMIIVVLFLILQPKLDRTDPRLRALAAGSESGAIAFEEEETL
jgi:hypothetical protein